MTLLRLPIVVQTLDEQALLAEALFFPEVSGCGEELARLQRALGENARRLLNALPTGELWQRRCGVPLEVGWTSLSLDPPPRAIAWTEPLKLRFPLVRWSQGPTVHIAFLPTLEIEVVADSPAELERLIPEQIRSALYRTKAAQSLKRLAFLQRCSELAVHIHELEMQIPSPKQAAIDARERRERRTPVIQTVGENLSRQHLAPAYERETDVTRLAEALTGRRPRSVLLIGPAGVGKTAVLRELVRRQAELGLTGVPFWATSGARLVAGMSGFGMWEERCQTLRQEAAAAGAILHLGNLVELMQVGKSELQGRGIAAFFRPYIARGALLVVAECTPEQLPLIQREDPHLLQAFQALTIEEPSPAAGRRILERFARATISADVAPLTPEALDTLDRLHRRYAAYSVYPGRPLRFLRNLLDDRPVHPVAVNTSLVTQAFARETGLPLFLIDEQVQLDLPAARTWLTERIIGQPEAVDLVVDLLATVKAGLTRPRKPIASLLFIGPTGVGKTETAKALAEFLFGDRQRMTRFDMSEFADPSAVQRLLGGGLDEGLLTARIRESPFSVILFDEFEKADPLFFDLLLQVLGEGRLTDAAGRLADFCNSVVIMTSNLGAATYQEAGFGFVQNGPARQAARSHFVREVQAFVRPELFNRIDRIVPFSPLDEATARSIAHRQVALIAERDGIRYRGVNLQIEPAVTDELARRGYDRRYGARPLKRAIERELLAPLAERINRYAPNTPLDVSAHLDAEAIKLEVKSQADEAGRQRAAGGIGNAEAVLVRRGVELRRNWQRLERGPAVLEIRNEIFRLARWAEKFRTRSTQSPAQSPDDLAQLARLTRRQELANTLARHTRTDCELEERMLMALYGGVAFELGEFAAAVTAGERRWQELLLEVYFLQFETAHSLTLAVCGETPQRVAALAAAYREVVTTAEGTADVWQIMPGRSGRGGAAPQAAGPNTVAGQPLEWRQKPDDGHGSGERVWQLVPRAAPAGTATLLERRQVFDVDQFFSELPEQTLGVVLALRGTGVAPRFLPEAGLHVFAGEREVECLVDCSDAALADYFPPAGIERRGGIGSQPRRRAYGLDQAITEDKLLDSKLPPQRTLPAALREAIERLLLQNAREVLDT